MFLAGTIIFGGGPVIIPLLRDSLAGAVIAWVGIFSPGLVVVHGTMGIWGAIRG
ncbi:uncharacterized protein B0T15DRAFT_490379 [Chaetomium strumarium]|uniref:Uncharacterized protein n=1 Tax=Chaetomium strumarium TaxID=1170767 RepID=A0AAJ0M3K0_9PEZI|nr:hypothetical protein B0T15DRAFT_490379 [Chaetomium strumarium]